MSCQCLTQPPVFDLPPPPDLSLVWNLISDDEYERVTDCEWGPFISISDVSSTITLTPLSSRSLIVTSIIALMTLISLCAVVICRFRRGRSRRTTKKSASSDGILTGADNVWTYNSMKNSCSGSTNVLVCNGTLHNQAYQNTPATIRSYATSRSVKPITLKPCTSTILHLHRKESSGPYCTVGKYSASPTESYEEIPPRGLLESYSSRSARDGAERNFSFTRESCRRPPPTCRPPPIPLTNISNESSPHDSDQSSIDRELAGMYGSYLGFQPTLHHYRVGKKVSVEVVKDEKVVTVRHLANTGGVHQLGKCDDVTRMPICPFSQSSNIHSMTYV
ncbi:hypothetical protein DICVIV_00030 [Dictyocaulus viviparus]|uniref:Uncharacterized protein n=1 Tax=Dictyocaulus viviparus TaxID=29172 RepID=A0A0D8YBL7_DICVI|nr:hypothetical protein DICVIV_00030 [Dictyocaulus viviparus]